MRVLGEIGLLVFLIFILVMSGLYIYKSFILKMSENRKEDKKKKEKGFTLIEVMIVIAIISIMAAIAVRVLKGCNSKEKSAIVKEEIDRNKCKEMVIKALNKN